MGFRGLFSVCFLGEAKGRYDTRINYSCSKASTEGCMEVALQDYYIMPVRTSQWVKMFWHKVGTKNPSYRLQQLGSVFHLLLITYTSPRGRSIYAFIAVY